MTNAGFAVHASPSITKEHPFSPELAAILQQLQYTALSFNTLHSHIQQHSSKEHATLTENIPDNCETKSHFDIHVPSPFRRQLTLPLGSSSLQIGEKIEKKFGAKKRESKYQFPFYPANSLNYGNSKIVMVF